MKHTMWQYKTHSSYCRTLYSQKLCCCRGRKYFVGLRLKVFYYNRSKNIYKYQSYFFFLILEVTEEIQLIFEIT